MAKQDPQSGKSEGTRSLTGKTAESSAQGKFNHHEPDGAQRRLAGDNWMPIKTSGEILNDRG